MKLHIFSYKFIVIDIRGSKRSSVSEKSGTEQRAEKGPAPHVSALTFRMRRYLNHARARSLPECELFTILLS